MAKTYTWAKANDTPFNHIYNLYYRQKTNLLNIAKMIRNQEKLQNRQTRKRHNRKNRQKTCRDIL